VRDQVSHPYSTTGKITVLYILIFSHALYNRKYYCTFIFSCFLVSNAATEAVRITRRIRKEISKLSFAQPWRSLGLHVKGFSEECSNLKLAECPPSHSLTLTRWKLCVHSEYQAVILWSYSTGSKRCRGQDGQRP
jgi:hypothetical protein